MLQDLISAHVSTRELTFKPGGTPACFWVNVVNHSPEFASFQLELLAATVDAPAPWYQLSPEISSKKPPGDQTQFQVMITDTPLPGFVGQMNLTVRVMSIDLGAETRQVLRLILEPGKQIPGLKVELPVREFQIHPRDRVELPVRVHHSGPLPVRVTLRCLGLEPDWLENGTERQILVKPAGYADALFLCQPPFGGTPSRIYPFVIQALSVNCLPGEAQGTLEILPAGFTDFRVHPPQQRIPQHRFGIFRRRETVRFDLTLDNASNLPQEVKLETTGERLESTAIAYGRAETVALEPETLELPPETTARLWLQVQQQRPWIGRVQKLALQVQAHWSDRRVELRHEVQPLELVVLPLISLWWPIAAGLLLLPPLLWWLSCLNPGNPSCGHADTVTSVQLNGVAEQIVSGSNDQTIKRWRVQGFLQPLVNQNLAQVGQASKAVRVIRYRPLNNDQVAVGLENGEIQVWDLLASQEKPRHTLIYKQEDRVLDLQFTADARSLFSGHGSGLVLRWNPQPAAQLASVQPQAVLPLDFAVYALALVGPTANRLAIAGQFNRLEIWDWEANQHHSLKYFQPGGQYDYIQSLATAPDRPHLLATADTQGAIALWNLSPCLQRGGDCQLLDQWSEGHGGKPVRAVALSANGCYLVSGGDDGRVVLWPLTQEGRRPDSFLNGQELDRSLAPNFLTATALNWMALNRGEPLDWSLFTKGAVGPFAIRSVDVKLAQAQVLVVSGSADTQVRVAPPQVRQRFVSNGCDRP